MPPLSPQLAAAFAPLKRFVTRAALEPYSVPERRGRTQERDRHGGAVGELMVRFVFAFYGSRSRGFASICPGYWTSCA